MASGEIGRKIVAGEATAFEAAFLGATGEGAVLSIPARFLARHGIIAGSTGTGKSRAMQVLAEQLADAGIRVFVSDVKGDASGFCAEGEENERNKLAPFGPPHAIKANYWSVGSRLAPLRFSVSAIGPVLLSRLLSLNPTQESHLALVFPFARRGGLPLDDLGQLMDVLDEMVGKGERGMSKSSVSVIQRKIMALQESGASGLFGKPSVSMEDLRGLNVLNLSDARRDMSVSIAPAFLLQVLFDSLPEVGDAGQPEFVIFFDEAHYLFKDANKSLRDAMVTILRQIRSKGVSVFFVTQDVTDIPDEILGQLSTKIIFSQKVFTQKGNQRLRALANSFPKSGMDVMERLKSLPPGTAVVSTLDHSGNQTAPEEVRVFAPLTTMRVVPDATLLESTDQKLLAKYRKKEAPQARKQAVVPEASSEKTVAEACVRKRVPEPERKKEAKTWREKGGRESGGGRGSIWNGIFGFLLKLLDFLLAATGKLFSFLIFRPGRHLFRWLMKKKIRVAWALIFLLLLYVIIVNWHIIQAFLDSLIL